MRIIKCGHIIYCITRAFESEKSCQRNYSTAGFSRTVSDSGCVITLRLHDTPVSQGLCSVL